MAGIAKIVSQKLGRPVHFERQKRPVEVLEVSGTYRQSNAIVEMTDGLSKPPHQDFAQQGSMDNFMMILADRLGYKPVNHVPDTSVTVRWHDGVVKRKTVDALLRNLSSQMSLQFSHHTESLDVWCMVDDAASDPGGGRHK